MPKDAKQQCVSIQSRKHPEVRCRNTATRNEFCAKHWKSKVLWTPPSLSSNQRVAAQTIQAFWIRHGRLRARRSHGPALFVPSESHNEKDLYTYESVTTIPFTYHFSYSDPQRHIWSFDLRFLVQLLQYGNEVRNPFTQELLPPEALERLQARVETLTLQKCPILYTETETLTPEQNWNQKVLDVFLKLTALGFGVNVLWFESLGIREHEYFYRVLYESWTYSALSHEERERIVPQYLRIPIFRWSPDRIDWHDLKWWRKQSLSLMNAFLSRGQDKATQGCGAIYILTALAKCHPRAREAFAWLVE
jgi:hypothetical protein